MEIISSSPVAGYLSLVLHAHLPFIRYPEHEHHLEERWLFEAMTETYIPLLDVFGRLLNDNVDFRITLSLTPTLIEMFNDSLLRERYRRYLDSLISLAEEEIFRTRGNAQFWVVAQMYRNRFLKIRHLFSDVYRKDLTSAFRAVSETGKIVIITSAATHGYLPILMTELMAARAQILLGAQHFVKNFGKKPEGIWLPECGFVPGIDDILKETGIKFFYLESHGILNSTPRPKYAVYMPIRTPSGITAFSRDVESSKQVWSSCEGYPGDADYRDFYRDIGFELDLKYLGPYLAEGNRTFTGFKYYRITGSSVDKQPYIYEKALKKAAVHAVHFLESKCAQALGLHEKLKIKPLITAAYDAELCGHWWFEGPEWLEILLRKGERQKTVRFISPVDYLSENHDIETAMPSISSWGNKGYSATWLDSTNDWIYRPMLRASRLMTETASKYNNDKGVIERTLNQAARELLLAQSSDWAFMMKTGNSAEFAKNKFLEHMRNFSALHESVTSGRIDTAHLSRLEYKNNIFHDIDFRVYCGKT